MEDIGYPIFEGIGIGFNLALCGIIYKARSHSTADVLLFGLCLTCLIGNLVLVSDAQTQTTWDAMMQSELATLLAIRNYNLCKTAQDMSMSMAAFASLVLAAISILGVLLLSSSILTVVIVAIVLLCWLLAHGLYIQVYRASRRGMLGDTPSTATLLHRMVRKSILYLAMLDLLVVRVIVSSLPVDGLDRGLQVFMAIVHPGVYAWKNTAVQKW